MQIFYIGILRPAKDGNKTLELASAKELSSFSFFQRSSVAQFMTFFSETIAERTTAGGRQSVNEGNYVGHAYTRAEGITGVIITDKEYERRPAYSVLNMILEEYLSIHPASEWATIAETTPALHYDNLEQYLTKYQNPTEADALMRVQKDLDETKVVLQQSIEAILKRGEHLDSLVDKSEALTASSRTFYKQAKKTNSCCVIV